MLFRKIGYLLLVAFGFLDTNHVNPIFALNVRSSADSQNTAQDSHFAKQITPAQKLALENQKAEALASFAKVLNALDAQYVDQNAVDINSLLEKALTAMLSDLDSHTSYLTPEQFQRFVTNVPNTLPKKVELKTSDLSHNIMYAKLPLFHAKAYEDIKTQLKYFKKNHDDKINGLVLDLRNNPGGLFEQAVKISNLFIDSGILVSSVGRDKTKPQQVEFALKSETFENFPIVVLVNENTASASEVVAGALQDRKRATIMGTTTYGKGSIQRLIPLANGGALKMTIARYYTPSGRSIQSEGIIPNIISPSPSGKKEVFPNMEGWDSNLNDDNVLKQAYAYLIK